MQPTPPNPADLMCTFEVAAVNPNPIVPVVPNPVNELGRKLDEMAALLREMVRVSHLQLELMQRNEERFNRQQQTQKEDFENWLDDHPDLRSDLPLATEVVRHALGSSIEAMVNHIKENELELTNSDFSRSELVDKFGGLLNHTSAMYGLLRRFMSVDQERTKERDPNSP